MKGNTDISDEMLVKRGKMEKSPLQMNPGEFRKWQKDMTIGIRDYLFSIGQPLIYKKEGRFVAEYANGYIKFL